jgi:V8-like Glu-specific endopeptidase
MAERFLTVEDRQALAQTISGVYDLQLGPAARLQFLTRAGLYRFAASIDMAASPNVLAGVLIDRLETFGPLSERPGYDALGALLAYVVAQPDTSREDARLMAEALVKYELVGDQDYLGKLRADFGITAAATRPIVTGGPPPSSPAPAAEPAFEAPEADEAALEVVINSEDNFLDIDLLAGAIYTSMAVGRVERPRGRALGTGFLVGPDLLLTNQHVLKSQDMLDSAVVRFDYQLNRDGVVTPGRVFEFVPDFYLSSPSTELDFALVRLKAAPLAERRLEAGEEDLPYQELLRRGRHRGYLLLAPSLIVERERVNIVQHPNGNPQKAVLTQNYVISTMENARVHYLADTMPGSSGSPVLNAHWDVVALHHSGGAHPPQKLSSNLQRSLKGHYKFNEGIPMRDILPQIERFLPRK